MGGQLTQNVMPFNSTDRGPSCASTRCDSLGEYQRYPILLKHHTEPVRNGVDRVDAVHQPHKFQCVVCGFTILAKAPGCPCVFELHNVVWDLHVPGEEMAVHRDNAPEFSITKKTVIKWHE